MFNQIIIIIMIAFVLRPFPVRATGADLVINEIGAYEASDHEWIEIYNKGIDPIDLTGWKFFEENTNHGLTAYRGDLVINGGEYAIIADVASNFEAQYPNFHGTIIDSSWSILKESGEAIALKDGSGTIIESFTYLAAGTGSLERVNPQLPDYSSNNWKENIVGNTAGFQNSVSVNNSSTNAGNSGSSGGGNVATSTPLAETNMTQASVRPQASNLPPYRAGTIVINEFLSEPGDDAVEWIEIFSKGETVISLDGWIIEDGLGKIAELGGQIFPQSYKVVELQNSRLNNAGDMVKILDDKGVIVDQVTYGNFDDGAPNNNAPRPKYPNVLARVGDGVDTDRDDFDWSLSTSATPNARNSVVYISQENSIEEEVDPSVSQPSGNASGKTVATSSPQRSPSTTVVASSIKEDSSGDAEDEPQSTSKKTQQKKSSASVRTVNGTVSVLPGVLGSQIFYVQTRYGGEEIYMFKKDFPEITLGDEVRITGKNGIIRGTSRIKVQNREDIDVLSHEGTPEASEIAIGDISEEHDSTLVKVHGEVIEIKGRGQFVISDGDAELLVYIKPGTGIGTLTIEEGSEVAVSGIVNILPSGPRLLPRGIEDIELPAGKTIATNEKIQLPIALNKDIVIGLLITLILAFGAATVVLAVKFKDKVFSFLRKPQDGVEEEIELDEY